MLKKIMAVALLAGLTSVAQAGEHKLLPLLDDGYTADFAIAITAGKTDFEGDNTGRLTTKGVELSLNCPLLKPANHTIRQQVSLHMTDENGSKSTSIELSPHHMWELGNKVSVGVGPSLGVTKIEEDNFDDTVFTYGVGTSARYKITKKFFVSGEARYSKSTDVEQDGFEDFDINNLRTTAKLGYQF